MSSAAKLPKVFVTRKVPEDGINYLRNKAVVTQWGSDDAITREELKKCVKGIDGLFCLLTEKVDAEILECAGSWIFFYFRCSGKINTLSIHPSK